MLKRRQRKAFFAKKKITKRIKVGFKTSSGEKVSFIAKKTVTKRVRVSFLAKRKRR